MRHWDEDAGTDSGHATWGSKRITNLRQAGTEDARTDGGRARGRRPEYRIGMRMQGPTAVMQRGARNESPMHSTTSGDGGCRDRWRPSIGTTNQPITTIIMNEARGENDSDQNWEQKTCSSTKHLQRKIQRNNYRKYHHTHRTNQVAEESMHSQLRQTMAALSSVVSSNYAGRAE